MGETSESQIENGGITMAEWLFELDLKGIWDTASKETEVTWMIPPWFIDQLITKLGVLLTQMESKLDAGMEKRAICEELQYFIEELKTMKTDEGIPKEEFDMIWDVIYDWADINVRGGKLCWIKTTL